MPEINQRKKNEETKHRHTSDCNNRMLYCVRLATPAAAEVIVNENVAYDRHVTLPDGIDVHLKGTLHEKISLTLDESGGFHITNHYQPRNLKGLGSNGETYIANGLTRWNLNGAAGSEYTWVNRFHIVGTGEDTKTYCVSQTTHFTVNANGDLATSFSHIDVTYK